MSSSNNVALKNQVAVVTGASKGIGAAIAAELAAQGAAVIVNYSSSEGAAAALVDKIKSAGGKAKAVRGDVAKAADAKKLVDAAVAEFGRLDILINNAGVYEFIPLDKIAEAQFDRMFNINVKGLLFASQAAAAAIGDRAKQPDRPGHIINLSSIASIAALATGSVYCASKAAVDAITRTLAAELGPRNILVNSVMPGPVETEGTNAMANWADFEKMAKAGTPLGRVGQPQDIASVVAFLCSNSANWITGQSIQTAGGFRA